MALMKAATLSFYFAHRDWDWPSASACFGGRQALASGHVDQVRTILETLTREQARFLAMPNVGRSRHFYTSAGQEKRGRVQAEKAHLLAVISRLYNALSAATEELKCGGMPAPEAARIREFANAMLTSWETLRSASLWISRVVHLKSAAHFTRRRSRYLLQC